MTKRRWLNAAINEAAKPQPVSAFSRQARLARAQAVPADKPIRAA
ncbi:hypothetical protein [Palleronia pontilimi]|nr:hypothetical protein [Palleronia pontilimi]